MSDAAQTDDRVRRTAIKWEVTALVLFAVLALIGLVMRAGQGALAEVSSDRFYSFMTLHGVGMAGAMFISSLAAVWYLLAREVEPFRNGLKLVYALVLAGVVGVIGATAIGQFAAGWYLLYPLPFVNAAWPGWSTGLFLIAMLVLGVGWLSFQAILLVGMGRAYGYRNLLGWQYFRADGPAVEIPPVVLITSVSIVAGIIAVASGAIFLVFNLFDWQQGTTAFSPLLMKNLVFLFGHTIVNITMYFGLAVVYALLPRYSGRNWPTNRIVVFSWNCALVFVLFAYFHHLYMDFVQPEAFQYLGQIASYASAVPATVVTIFGAIGQAYRSGIRWTFVPLALFLALMGWVIGGFAAVVDSTIVVNSAYHNTMWVPAHFHTYFLMGYLLILFAFIYRLLGSTAEGLAKGALVVMLTGGYGFLVMFYVGGALGVPRRYASYDAVPIDGVQSAGRITAEAGTVFTAIFLLGFLLYLAALFVHRAPKSVQAPTTGDGPMNEHRATSGPVN